MISTATTDYSDFAEDYAKLTPPAIQAPSSTPDSLYTMPYIKLPSISSKETQHANIVKEFTQKHLIDKEFEEIAKMIEMFKRAEERINRFEETQLTERLENFGERMTACNQIKVFINQTLGEEYELKDIIQRKCGGQPHLEREIQELKRQKEELKRQIRERVIGVKYLLEVVQLMNAKDFNEENFY